MTGKFWLVAVNMGYGHQRTAFPLKEFAFENRIINANDYEGIPPKDRRIWEITRRGYEFISRFKRIPLIGEAAFYLYDRFQKIIEFYPKRNLSMANFQIKQVFSMVERGWGEHLINKLKENPLPIVTTFFTPAFMAEHYNYPGDIYCIICDTDMARAWVPINPSKSRIKYFAPTYRVAERLKLYGVKKENIIFTGYPLPLENIGGRRTDILKEDLRHRILNLDPQKNYRKYYTPLLNYYLGELPKRSNHPLTLTFTVGGAGAQRELGIKIVKNLLPEIKKKKVKVILIAGVKEGIRNYFFSHIKKLGLSRSKNVEVLFDEDINGYFSKFNLALRQTDILWTKPSELSFYSALGLPIIIAPSIGSQEDFNKRWLVKSGFGSLQGNPDCIKQWLYDWLDKGYLAEAAMQGFVEGERFGALNIKEIFEK